MNSILFSVSSDIVVILNKVIQDIHQLREHSLLFRLILAPVLYVLIAAKIFLNGANAGTYRFYHVSLPYGGETVRNHFFSATPMSIYCFNKRGFALVGAEVILFFYLLCVPLRKPALIVPYLAMKVALSTIPFVALTPVERLPLWLLAALFTTLEIRMGLWFIRSWGYGINFRNHHFYNHWGKHYRYRHITSNRVIGVWLCRQIYVTVKLLFLNDYFCYDKAVFNARLAASNKPTKGAFTVATELLVTPETAVIFITFTLLLLLFLTHWAPVKNSNLATITLTPLRGWWHQNLSVLLSRFSYRTAPGVIWRSSTWSYGIWTGPRIYGRGGAYIWVAFFALITPSLVLLVFKRLPKDM